MLFIAGKRGDLPDNKESLTTGMVNVVDLDSEEPATCKVIVTKPAGEITWTVDENECTEGFRLAQLQKKYFNQIDLQQLTQGMLIDM